MSDPPSIACTAVADLVTDTPSLGQRDEIRERFWQAVERIRERNANEGPDDVLRFVTEVVEEVCQEQYERERASADGR